MMLPEGRSFPDQMKSDPQATYDDGMVFLRRVSSARSKAALFPGAWNPPTIAHLEIARRSLDHVEEVVFTIPREFPHKEWQGASRDTRLAWLMRLAAGDPRFSVALTDGGLFLDMTRELRAVGPMDHVYILCGGDAAHRAVTWDYGSGEPIEPQLEEYSLLVAPRPTPYTPPPHLTGKVMTLPLPEDLALISSTAVREAFDSGRDWTHLVPGSLQNAVRDSFERR
jgi:nicotinic acid mononucleotide adenylyltransferase